MKFDKYHALGNDYLVVHPSEFKDKIDEDIIKRICHRNYGVGSDGVLIGPFESKQCDFKLMIFNPDGSEAEKSGNGLRIFARSLLDNGHVLKHQFSVETKGGDVNCIVAQDKSSVKVEMGNVSFDSEKIPVSGAKREVLEEKMKIKNQEFVFSCATVGNPHCVILMHDISDLIAKKIGPIIESHSLFPNKTNVQFMKILDRGNIQIEIWERGAGYTLASGSSSTAAAAVAYRLGLCSESIQVNMPGGQIKIELDDSFNAVMEGSITKICSGFIEKESLTYLV